MWSDGLSSLGRGLAPAPFGNTYLVSIGPHGSSSAGGGIVMDSLWLSLFWTGPIGVGAFFAGLGVLFWGIGQLRGKKE